jgi:hypothetical protein
MSNDEQTFSVVEVEIELPHVERIMESGLSDRNAEAFIALAVLRRGVETHFYMKRSNTQPLALSNGDNLKENEK